MFIHTLVNSQKHAIIRSMNVDAPNTLFPKPHAENIFFSRNSDIAPVSAQVPIIVGEVGDTSVCGGTSFLSSMLAWHDAHGHSVLAWT